MNWTCDCIFYFECPECGMNILEGNPLKCPHQRGDAARAYYNPSRDGMVANWEQVLAECGVAEVPSKKKAKPSPPPVAQLTFEDMLAKECPKGG